MTAGGIAPADAERQRAHAGVRTAANAPTQWPQPCDHACLLTPELTRQFATPPQWPIHRPNAQRQDQVLLACGGCAVVTSTSHVHAAPHHPPAHLLREASPGAAARPLHLCHGHGAVHGRRPVVPWQISPWIGVPQRPGVREAVAGDAERQRLRVWGEFLLHLPILSSTEFIEFFLPWILSCMQSHGDGELSLGCNGVLLWWNIEFDYIGG